MAVVIDEVQASVTPEPAGGSRPEGESRTASMSPTQLRERLDRLLRLRAERRRRVWAY